VPQQVGVYLLLVLLRVPHHERFHGERVLADPEPAGCFQTPFARQGGDEDVRAGPLELNASIPQCLFDDLDSLPVHGQSPTASGSVISNVSMAR
jgi:hypothetical protein